MLEYVVDNWHEQNAINAHIRHGSFDWVTVYVKREGDAVHVALVDNDGNEKRFVLGQQSVTNKL